MDGWFLRFRNIQAYFDINTTNNKFELYTDIFDEFACEELKDELEEILNVSDITPYHLRHEKIGPHKIEA